jgi:hypothetical protein
MAITDHVGILVAGSFDRPQINKLKKDAPAQYYAVVAYEPSAGADLGAAMATIAPGGNWQSLQHGVKKNSALAKPYAGIADDALIVRFATQFAPEIYDESGKAVAASQENSAHIRSQLFAGQRVRINGAPYAWNFQGKQGLSWNLYGGMAVGGGERRQAAGGSFDQYLPKQTSDFDQAAQQPAQQAAPGTQTNEHPFVQQNGAAAFSAPVADPAKPFG